MKNAKGELSINMIIMAVIAIIILVVIIFLVMDVFGGTKRETSCPKNGGVCVEGYKCSEPIVGIDKPITCTDVSQVCCKPSGII
jgi:hypothetical protein